MLILPARLRRVLASVVGCTVTVALIVVSPGQAHAASSTTCIGTSHVVLSPGLTLTPQTVKVTETDALTSCTSTDPTLTSGTMGPFVFSAPNASCNNVSGLGADGVRITWNNGQTSTVIMTVVTTITGGIVQETGTGPVVAGEFAGANAVITWIYALVNPLQCLLPGGMTVQEGTIVAQITAT